ncbi:MAG: TadE/TadG family type IV pilus assembly protein [Anaerolineae bacterium]|nr:TadE/TadG family type IV pilus assembly protein [Anaerolineae bacterium]
MIRRFISLLQRYGRYGQSMTETALFLPIIILLLAGAVEVSNLLVTQNRVTTASRVATGFAAANVHEEDWLIVDPPSGWPAQVAQVARNNVTETLDLDPVRWDIYTVKARLGENADFDGATGGEWDSYHAWGVEQTFSQSAWDAAEAVIQHDIIEALNDTETVPAEGLELVATVAYHDRHSLLGLDAFNLGPFTRIRGLTVMRVDEPAEFVGCPLVPIGVRVNQFSMYPSNWPTGDPVCRNPAANYPEDPVGDTQIFPEEREIEYPSGLTYINRVLGDPENGVCPQTVDSDTFVNNVPGVPLRDAQPGYIYRARDSNNLDTAGGFGWFSWDGATSEPALAASLWPPPGNFIQAYPGSRADTNTIPHFDSYAPGEVSGDGNGFLEIGEWVENSTGNIHSVAPLIANYFSDEVPATLIVYDEYTLSGSNAVYRVAGFVKVNMLAYKFGERRANDKWIIFEFLNWADACRWE